MSDKANLQKEAMDMLLATSRTFFIPISHLPEGIQEAVASAYLCMRAIDEIEDHPDLSSEVKDHLLRSTSKVLQSSLDYSELSAIYDPYKSLLPEVTLRLSDWLALCPTSIVNKVAEATATMANGMAKWATKSWEIMTEEDLDDYTYYVAGLVGVMLSDIWIWYNGTETKRDLAIAFGRGLQAVNILRNRSEDGTRGVSFYPEGWGDDEMFEYARRNLALADVYTDSLNTGPIHNFCKIPLLLAHATVNALVTGKNKLTRTDVTQLVKQVIGE